jgi:hypothetical protein
MKPAIEPTPNKRSNFNNSSIAYAPESNMSHGILPSREEEAKSFCGFPFSGFRLK